jgi:hypothetical protein
MILTPIRISINEKMETAPRSCTGWSCSCAAPYGFGEGRNKICHVYGPSADVTEDDYKKHTRGLRAAFLRMKWKNNEYLAPLATHKAEQYREKMMEKLRETLDWHLDFEDQVRTQNFFEKRERELRWQRMDEEAKSWWRKRAESAAEWDRYREAELESSCRSIRTLHYDDC